MTERFLISHDPFCEGFVPDAVSVLGNLFITVLPSQLSSALRFLENSYTSNNSACAIYVNAISLQNVQDVIALLDHGAVKVFVSRKHCAEITEGNLVEDCSRIVLCLNNATSGVATEEHVDDLWPTVVRCAKLGVGAYFRYTDHGVDQKLVDALREYQGGASNRPSLYAELSGKVVDNYVKAIKDGHVPIISAKCVTTEPEQFPDRIPAAHLLTAVLQTDRPDGLFTTIVSDERGICLGLVYSSAASIGEALRTNRGVYHSRSRKGLWRKGETSGDHQMLVAISLDCDRDALQFRVRQLGNGFCHLQSATCFGPYSGLSRLQRTLRDRKVSAPPKSYTARLFQEPKLLQAKIMEEASELCEATSKDDVAAEAADLLYFAMTKCVAAGVDLTAIERNLDFKSMKTTRRKGDAKPEWDPQTGLEVRPTANGDPLHQELQPLPDHETVKEAASIPKDPADPAGFENDKIRMKRYRTSSTPSATITQILQRPSQRSTDQIMSIVSPIITDVRSNGDAALLRYTHKFEKATSLTSPILKSPFPWHFMQIPPETVEAIDISFENIRRFHAAQKESKPLQVETMPGVICSRFSRPIERVGLYVPGGTAVLPSTALMLGVPAMVAGCKQIVLASPPRPDGTISPEIVYIAHKVGAESIVLAGGAQAVAALAYGTESIPKVDKILGPGNQFVTAGKMIVSNDTTAGVSIDMPAGPSEVLVVADKTANPAFVASDLLSQAEHGTDSQVVLIAVGLEEERLWQIEEELHAQANVLPRVDIVRGAIEHSVTLEVGTIVEAMELSNQYAPEHLILQVEDAEKVVELVDNAGSVFIGPWTPESVGDYSAGVNHSLPTYGYAKQYSGVNLSSFTKHITSSNLSREGLKQVSAAVMQLAKVEELEAHRRAVSIRLEQLDSL